SHFAFGQDSLVIDNIRLEALKKVLTWEETGKQPDTIYIKENKYVLSKTERDSIFNSVYLQEKTQQLLKNYENGVDKDIFLTENHFNFLAVLNSNLVHYKKKRNLLIDRIKHDEQTIIVKKRNIQTHSDRISPSRFNLSNNKQPV